MKRLIKTAEKHLSDTNFMRNILEILYLLSFAVILSDAFLHTTMFLKMFGDHTQLHIFMKIALLAIIIAKLSLTDKQNWKRMLLIVLFITCFTAAFYRRSHYDELLTMGLLIIGANQVSFRKIAKVFLVTGISITIITMVAAQMGIIENLIYHQSRATRISFGSVYPTDFSAHIVYLVLSYIYLREKRLKYIELTIFIGLAVFIYYFCNARTNAGCIIFISLICFFLKLSHTIKEERKIGWLKKAEQFIHRIFVFSTKYSMLFLFSIMIILTALYSESSPIMVKLDNLFTYRLSLGKEGFDNYPVGLLGQYIKMTGLGGKLEHPDVYFFIDSSYTKMVLCYGLAVCTCVLLIYLLIGKRAQQRNNMYLLAIIGIISIQCMFEHHILEICYNPFTLAVLANFDTNLKERSPSYES